MLVFLYMLLFTVWKVMHLLMRGDYSMLCCVVLLYVHGRVLYLSVCMWGEGRGLEEFQSLKG
jgi:hypothetical protein